VIIEHEGQRHELSPLWLRERTQAPDQLEAMTQQRLFDSHAIDADLTLTRAARVGEQKLGLSFSDGHHEHYDLSTLTNELGGTEVFPTAEP
jgi:gamma-butyrobetaine dioxygenase